MVERQESHSIYDYLFKGKALLLLGPRQVGKTTLVQSLRSRDGSPTLFWNGDEPDVREWMPRATSTRFRELIGSRTLVVIDEAQRIENVGVAIKLIVDQLPGVQVVATGSSVLELSSALLEPLTGRKYVRHLFPLSFQELARHHGELEEIRLLEQRLVFGYYPEVVTNPTDALQRLKLIADSYLYKDLLSLGSITKPKVLENIVRALALQVGAEVSTTEIASLVGADRNTVERYLDLLEKAYVVFSLPAMSRNVRNEIKKGRKVYFWDNGIRNAVLGNFAPLSGRTDLGALWENFLVAERRKRNAYTDSLVRSHFWRTVQQQEIDYLEEFATGFAAFEFKWSPKATSKFSKTFTANYPVLSTQVIHRENFQDFLLER